MLSEYISEGGGYTASVNRITLNGNVMYQVVKRGLTACDVTLGYYDREDEAVAIAEESIINVLSNVSRLCNECCNHITSRI